MNADSLGKLFGREQAIGFNDSPFAMDPLRLDGIEPGTFRWEQKGQDAHTFAFLLDQLVMLPYPGTHLEAFMPGSVIPDQQPGRLALGLQPRATPLQKLGGDGADRTACDEAKRHVTASWGAFWSLLPQHPITGQGFGVRITFLPGWFHQADRLVFALLGRQVRKRKPAPPDLVQKTNGPAGLLAGPGDQPIACVFFSWYWGSGLVIQCLARFQLVPNRLRARRTLAMETWVGRIPCSKLTWAASSKVQVPRSLPKSRGLRCKSSFSCLAPFSEKVVRNRWGREEPALRTASPFALKPLITLRTVWSSQPSCLAMAGARSPRPEASRIWQRRKMKALDERNPAWSCWCSS